MVFISFFEEKSNIFMLGYRLAEKTGVEALWRREENCPQNLIYITSIVAGVEKPRGRCLGRVEIEFFRIFLPYSFRLIGPQTKKGNMHPWSVKIGLRISEMTLSNQSHFPGFFLPPESHLVGYCKSYKMKNVPVLDVHSVQAACDPSEHCSS
jgi:hypothetical protein